jgi:hypothetical protein
MAIFVEPRGRYADWAAPAVELVERACARHGGWKRFERLAEVTANVEMLGGPLPWMKGLGRTFPAPCRVRVVPHAQRTDFIDWPEAGSLGRFEGGSVRITGVAGPSIHDPAHRTAMPRGRWSPADALYFFGYALANYLSLPFLLAATRYVKHGASSVTVRFADGFDTHSAVQSFHFDDTGLLARHDYRADVVGAWATGSHFTRDYVEASGMQFATTRYVRGRLGALVTPVPVLGATLRNFEVDDGVSG